MEVNPSDYPITIPYKSTSPQDPEAGILREEFSAFERESQCINLQDECWAFDEGVVGTDKSPEVSLDFTHRVCQFVAVGDCQGTLEAVTVYSGWLVNGHYNYRESIFIAHHTGIHIPGPVGVSGLWSGIGSFFAQEDRRRKDIPEWSRVLLVKSRRPATELVMNECDRILEHGVFCFKRTSSTRIVTKFLARDRSVQRAATQLAATRVLEKISTTLPVLCYDSANGGRCHVLVAGDCGGDSAPMNERIKAMFNPNADVFTDANGHCRLLPGYVAPAGTLLSKVAHLNRYELIDDSRNYGYDVPAVEDAVLQRDCVEKLAFYGRHCSVDMNAVNAAVNEIPIPPTFGRLRAALNKLDEAATSS